MKASTARQQHKYIEIGCDSYQLDNYSNEQGLNDWFRHNEELDSLKMDLLAQLLETLKGKLTLRQQQLLYLRYVKGLSQVEIANILGITQSGVSLQINGKPQYVFVKHHGRRKVQGGLIRKLQKLCKDNPEIQETLKSIQKVK
jgi:predicted DNA-binding protein YlxM (UPF0122 family)